MVKFLFSATLEPRQNRAVLREKKISVGGTRPRKAKNHQPRTA